MGSIPGHRRLGTRARFSGGYFRRRRHNILGDKCRSEENKERPQLFLFKSTTMNLKNTDGKMGTVQVIQWKFSKFCNRQECDKDPKKY